MAPKEAPKESDVLLQHDDTPTYGKQFPVLGLEASFSSDSDASANSSSSKDMSASCRFAIVIFATLGAVVWTFHTDSLVGKKLRSGVHSVAQDIADKTQPRTYRLNGSGPYSLVEAHRGKSFFEYYEFIDGPDSLGSAGYNTYVGRDKAESLGLIQVENNDNGDEYVYLSSKSGKTYDEYGNRFRDSVRLEGTKRFDHGLILLDVDKMPTGCGVWPAFWTTDATNWPYHGEIDIVEPINNQEVAKTALHTSAGCNMYAHVPRFNWTGHWDSATGLPNRFTGLPDFDSKLEADNCWNEAPHQWYNQGCVGISDKNGTIGEPMNEPHHASKKSIAKSSTPETGGIYALEWDPNGGYIKSWVFPRKDGIPRNLEKVLESHKKKNKKNGDSTSLVRPDPMTWPTPYAYFAIGEGSGCSADHFQNHRLVLNLAFCGAVAGNRFRKDCPALYEKFNVNNDSVATCNAYLESDEARTLLDEEAFWKIKGVYLYQRDEQ